VICYVLRLNDSGQRHVSLCSTTSSTALLLEQRKQVTTVVTTDASSVAFGACLSQAIDGEKRPIAFASRVDAYQT
jgi:hypothetical protein